MARLSDHEEHVGSRRLRRSLLLAAILVAGALCVWWLAVRADRHMRADLLRQADLVAKAVNLDRVKALAGTEADLASPDYLRLKDQFVAVRSANPKCRFVYLMGRKPDGTVFIHVDSEPADSEDYSPPGDVYEEVSEEYLRAFDAKTALVAGPVADRWGTWVTSLIPLADPETGDIVAVLGMDIDARDWKWGVAAQAALPAGLVLALMIGLVAMLLASGRASASPKPVLRRLLPTLAGLLMLLVGGA